MKLLNPGVELTLKYDGEDKLIPAGEIEVADEALANFIIAKTRSFDVPDIVKTGDSDNADIKAIKSVVKEVEVVEEVIEEEVKVKKPATTKKK